MNKILFSFFMIFFSGATLAQSSDVSIRNAKIAYNRVELKECRIILNEIIESPSSTIEDRTEALQIMGMQDWTLFRDYNESLRHLKSALLENESKSETYLLLSQVNLEASKFPEAYGFIENALTESRNETDWINASLLKARIIHDENVAAIKQGDNPDSAKLLIASDVLKSILKKQPGSPSPAELLLGISLMRKDGGDILKAWKSYYFVTDEENINQVLLPSYKILTSGFPQWNQTNLVLSERLALIKALAQSNFYDYAFLVATCKMFGSVSKHILKHKDVVHMLNFYRFIEGVQSVNDSFYPKIVIQKTGYEEDYTNAMTKEAKKLWIQLDDKNTKENFTEEKFFSSIQQQYGALGFIGNTNGFVSMLLGLIIHNEVREVDQYGYKADFRYVSISRMVSKDFTTWHGSANVGGWGTETSMIQVRDAYLQAPFTRLSWVTDASAREQIIDEIEKAKAIDLVNCQKDRYAEPSYLMMAFRLKASESLFDSLQKKGLKDEALAIAFINETMRLNIESAVFAHEARHAIDQFFFKSEFDKMTDDEKELRAKFSEIAFAPKFKMASTGSILGGDLDTNTSHGMANFRLRKIIVDWMEKHKSEIVGLHESTPLIMQMELLSDEELTSICREADPLASKP